MLVEEPIPAKPLTTSRALQQHLFSLLQNCKTLKKLIQIHTQILINGFSKKNYILVKLLSFYVTSGHLLSAHNILKNIENPSTTVWNQMIRGFVQIESVYKSVELLNQMVERESVPDGFTYSFILSGCARSGLLKEGEQVHGRVLANGYRSDVYVKTNLVNLYAMAGSDRGVENARKVFDDVGERNVVTWNSILAAYIRCGNIDGARMVFDEMPERNIVSWTSMIAGCGHNGKCRQALFLFNEMRRACVHLDQVALVAALSACAELGDIKLGRWIHSYIEETLSGKSEPLLVSLNNALIHMYASCGAIEEAYEVFRWMPTRSTVSWTSMITAFAKQGYAQEALFMFQLMQSLGAKEAKPDDITFIGVLCACSHAGFVDEGSQYFKNMLQSWGIKPRIQHYGCMVDLLSRAGFLEEAHDLIESMPIKPNDVVWGALLGGCRMHKNIELASHVAQKLLAELDSDQAAGYLLLLSHMFATAQRWEDVATIRKKMVEMGVIKPAGRSWVQINGIVYDFVAGDRTHKDESSIYEMLGNITGQAKCEGYKPDILNAFSVVE